MAQIFDHNLQVLMALPKFGSPPAAVLIFHMLPFGIKLAENDSRFKGVPGGKYRRCL